MKKRLVIFLILFCGYGFEAMAASYAYSLKKCQEEMKANPPQVEIVYSYGAMKLDSSKSASEIENIFQAVYPQEKAGNINGLTLLSPYTQLENRIAAKMVGGRICYYPQHIQINTGYVPVVYIAKDISQNSCRFRLTVRHEQTHLDIGYLSLQKFVKRLHKEFAQIVQNIGPEIREIDDKNATADAVAQKMNEKYHARLKILFDSFVQKLVAENKRIDTLQNYRDESALCPR